jgi:hypothetical protein
MANLTIAFFLNKTHSKQTSMAKPLLTHPAGSKLHPLAPSPRLGEGEPEWLKAPLPKLGEGFGERAERNIAAALK